MKRVSRHCAREARLRFGGFIPKNAARDFDIE